MAVRSTFTHVNLIARDWRRLAQFYERVLGCTPVPPERDLAGQWLDDSTGIRGAHIRGIHLRLPGDGGSSVPTLEIFQYDRELDRAATAPNRPGWGHIAFAVEDVVLAREAVIAAGGVAVGELVSANIAGAGSIAFAYVADPEGNIIELQCWAHDEQDAQDRCGPDPG